MDYGSLCQSEQLALCDSLRCVSCVQSTWPLGNRGASVVQGPCVTHVQSGTAECKPDRKTAAESKAQLRSVMLGPQRKRSALPLDSSITQCPSAPCRWTSFARCKHGCRPFPVATRGKHRRPSGSLHCSDGNGYGGRAPATLPLPGLLFPCGETISSWTAGAACSNGPRHGTAGDDGGVA